MIFRILDGGAKIQEAFFTSTDNFTRRFCGHVGAALGIFPPEAPGNGYRPS
jgi:hypothetical protein